MKRIIFLFFACIMIMCSSSVMADMTADHTNRINEHMQYITDLRGQIASLTKDMTDRTVRIIMLEKEVVLDNEDASRDSSANTNYNWVSKTEWQATMKNNDDRFSKLEKDMSEIKQILLDIKENRMHAEEL